MYPLSKCVTGHIPDVCVPMSVCAGFILPEGSMVRVKAKQLGGGGGECGLIKEDRSSAAADSRSLNA